MIDIAVKVLVGLFIALLAALIGAWWREHHPPKISRVERWLYARAERKVAAMADLTPAARAERIAQIRNELNNFDPPRPFGDQVRHDFPFGSRRARRGRNPSPRL